MPATENTTLVALTVLLYVAVLWLPGLLAGFATGLRGWTLATVAPLLSYLVAGVFGPLTTAIGISWSVWTYLGATAVTAAVLFGAHALAGARTPLPKRPSPWSRREHVLTCGALLIAALGGAAIVLGATGGLTHIPQDWDAAFHANGIRYITDTGDGSLTGMGTINWYEHGGSFYANAYHLVGAVVYALTGTPVGVVLNTQTVLLPGMLALGLIALLHRFGIRALTAGFTALVAVSSVSALYDLLWRGPLLPFETGTVLLPGFMLLVTGFLDDRRADTGLLCAAGAVGLLAIQPSGVFSAALYLLPLLLFRWWGDARRFARELGGLALAGIVAIGIGLPYLLGSLASAASAPPLSWDSDFKFSRAVGSLLSFQYLQDHPQIWLAVPLWIGLATFARLRGARWLLGSAALFGALFVLATAYNSHHIAALLTRPWWNDQYRLIALATIPLTVVAGHGLTRVTDWLAELGRRVPGLPDSPYAAAALVLIVFFVLSNRFYYGTNSTIMAKQYRDGPAVTSGEYRAMQYLGKLVEPGQRVMNDRYDGSVWMYAVAGVHPAAGHYDYHRVGRDPDLLQRSFDHYDSDPAVRAAVRRLHIKWVVVGKGFVRKDAVRATGLDHLGAVDELHRVYRNEDAAIYRLG